MIKVINFGTIKNTLSRNLSEAYINNDANIDKIKENFTKFTNIVKQSPILTLEYIIFKNLEDKTIKEDISATRYIDENLSLLKEYSKQEIIKENEKLEEFEFVYNNSLICESIQNIILENSNNTKTKNIDKIHESFESILSHIKCDKNNSEILTESKDSYDEILKYFSVEKLVEVALDKFEKKYSNLSENDKHLLNIIMDKKDARKNEYLSKLKEDIISTLKLKTEEVEDKESYIKINESIDKVSLMSYNETTYLDDIFKLIDLKESL